MATGAPGGNFRGWTPTPPERGSFPLDHLGECTEYMTKYLSCMKFTENRNAPNCRILAKQYLGCRMEHELMEKSNWDSLGLINLPGEKTEKHLFSPDEETSPKSASTDPAAVKATGAVLSSTSGGGTSGPSSTTSLSSN